MITVLFPDKSRRERKKSSRGDLLGYDLSSDTEEEEEEDSYQLQPRTSLSPKRDPSPTIESMTSSLPNVTSSPYNVTSCQPSVTSTQQYADNLRRFETDTKKETEEAKDTLNLTRSEFLHTHLTCCQASMLSIYINYLFLAFCGV